MATRTARPPTKDPAGDGLFTDGAGPDASAIVWDFARRHPKGPPA
ncbi:hypothetical protein ACWD6L_30240 [Micromonospora profundi]|uniref:Uncharacterized protein n=1 Tax=Micromonospora echinospora TaxID=1877 RepID=A0ABR6MD49_MICEC|nr:hypothetical protein [Micromonospora sp. NRRL B-16802]MBB5113306.1 hypothetical protein [Micromonospora echinospora]